MQTSPGRASQFSPQAQDNSTSSFVSSYPDQNGVTVSAQNKEIKKEQITHIARGNLTPPSNHLRNGKPPNTDIIENFLNALHRP